MKLFVFSLFLAGSMFGQTLLVSVTNLSSTSPLRRVLPVGVGPTVELLIFDPVLTDTGYTVALTYTTADGQQHVESKQFAAGMTFNGNIVTLASFSVDAATVSVQVLAQTYTGATASAVSQ